uniref:Heat shock factor-binding protein 1 n=1 Tax=Pipistrellus kuhlii TaxID=59472 RepID=A0A7J7V0B7_PIPKU|nr:heat shock factor binding protein 1 [Pipistrellus kuhlii]
MAETDPKTVQDLTSVVQTLLQQMQDKFQTMSDQIIGRNILYIWSQPPVVSSCKHTRVNLQKPRGAADYTPRPNVVYHPLVYHPLVYHPLVYHPRVFGPLLTEMLPHDTGWRGRTGRGKQDTCYTKELKVANLHWNLEHCFYKPREDQMAFCN